MLSIYSVGAYPKPIFGTWFKTMEDAEQAANGPEYDGRTAVVVVHSATQQRGREGDKPYRILTDNAARTAAKSPFLNGKVVRLGPQTPEEEALEIFRG